MGYRKNAGVQDIISSHIATVEANSTVEGAGDLMLKNKVRHLLVVNADRLPVAVDPRDLNKSLRVIADNDDIKPRILEAVLNKEMRER